MPKLAPGGAVKLCTRDYYVMVSLAWRTAGFSLKNLVALLNIGCGADMKIWFPHTYLLKCYR